MRRREIAAVVQDPGQPGRRPRTVAGGHQLSLAACCRAQAAIASRVVRRQCSRIRMTHSPGIAVASMVMPPLRESVIVMIASTGAAPVADRAGAGAGEGPGQPSVTQRPSHTAGWAPRPGGTVHRPASARSGRRPQVDDGPRPPGQSDVGASEQRLPALCSPLLLSRTDVRSAHGPVRAVQGLAGIAPRVRSLPPPGWREGARSGGPLAHAAPPRPPEAAITGASDSGGESGDPRRRAPGRSGSA